MRKLAVIFVLVALVLGLLPVTSVHAAGPPYDRGACAPNCYVSPTGNDFSGNGTQGSPWKTFIKCYNEISGGDTCWFQPGTYNSPDNASSDTGEAQLQGWDVGGPCANNDGVWNPAVDDTGVAKAPFWCTRDRQNGGSAGNPKVFAAVTPGTVIWTRDYNVHACSSNMGIRGNADYLKFIGIKFIGQWIAQTGASGVEFTQNIFDCPNTDDGSNWGSLLTGDNTASNMTGWWIHDNLFTMSASCTTSASCAHSGNGSSCGKPSNHHLYSLSGAIVENNDYTIDAGYLFANGDATCSAIGMPTGQPHSALGFKNKDQGNIIRYNYVNVAPGAKLSQCVWLSGTASTGSTGANQVYQNVCVGADKFILQEGDALNDKFYNLTAYRTGRLYEAGPQTPSSISGSELFNSILVNSASSKADYYQSSDGSALVQNQSALNWNDYFLTSGTLTFQNGGASQTGLPAWQSYLTGLGLGSLLNENASRLLDPLFVNASGGDFHLQASSLLRSGGRGGSYSSILGAYITGNEKIGCSFNSLCHAYAGGGDTTPPAAPTGVVVQ